MKGLHSIVIKTLEALVWGYLYGGNGRQIGNVAHLWRLERGTPPPLDPNWNIGEFGRWNAPNHGDMWNRAYWGPWSNAAGRTRQELITPMCGPIRTQSRFPRLNWATARWNPRLCQDCRAISEGAYFDILRGADPWLTMTRDERLRRPDPVSGV